MNGQNVDRLLFFLMGRCAKKLIGTKTYKAAEMKEELTFFCASWMIKRSVY